MIKPEIGRSSTAKIFFSVFQHAYGKCENIIHIIYECSHHFIS